MTEDEAQALLRRLSRHYNQPVLPLQQYCRAFEDWFDVARPYLRANYPELDRALDTMKTVVRKSNLLHRLLYQREGVRRIQCPKHRGRWSGCSPTPCACRDALGNDTGWLPEPSRERQGALPMRLETDTHHDDP